MTFRGRAWTADEHAESIAAYPNWLPIGPRVGSYLAATTDAGAPMQVVLDHSFRNEQPDDYMTGNGSYLRVDRPQLSSLTPSGDPPGYGIVFDGCRVPIYQGPYDGSNPAYPDLRA